MNEKKGRFQGVALKILAKIMTEEKSDEKNPEDDVKSTTRSKNKIELSPRRIKRSSDFRTVVKLASMKHLNKVINGPRPRDVLMEDHIPKLPEKPRFSATLSPEAQYATLQCYEDALKEKIKKNENSQVRSEDEEKKIVAKIEPKSQLLVSSRVERAMKILDEVDEKENSENLKLFRSWTTAWNDDFKQKKIDL